MPPVIRIGTRGSPLALAQAQMVKAKLRHAGVETIIEVIQTTGDHVLDRPLSEIGGKGLFTKEIDEALLSERIDIAVHSMKDVPTFMAEGIRIGAMLPRADERDALIGRKRQSIDDLPEGAVVGTSSLRRQSQLKAQRPDLHVVSLRGNVATRMKKVEDGEIDATLLAMAGLHRLGIALNRVQPLDVTAMLPAVGQGAIGIAAREADDFAVLWRILDDPETSLRVACERAVLSEVKGDCKTPIGVFASLGRDARIHVKACLGEADGKYLITADAEGSQAEYGSIGRSCGHSLLADSRSHQILNATESQLDH